MLVSGWLVGLAWVSPAGAEPAGSPAGARTQAARPRDARADGWRKGSSEWTAIGGGAEAVSINHSRADRQFLMQALGWGRVVSHPRGPRPLRGQLELVVEVVPLFVMFQSQRVYGYGASPIFFRWNFVGRRLQPFVELAGGLLRTDHEVPEGTRRRNFTAQAGLGFRLWIGTRRALLFGYRFHHLSNGGPGPINPGVNSNFVYAGLSILR